MTFEQRLNSTCVRVPCGFLGESPSVGESRPKATEAGTWLRGWGTVSRPVWLEANDKQGRAVVANGVGELAGGSIIRAGLAGHWKGFGFYPKCSGKSLKGLSRRVLQPDLHWCGCCVERRRQGNTGDQLRDKQWRDGSVWAEFTEKSDLFQAIFWRWLLDRLDVWCQRKRGVKGNSKTWLTGLCYLLWWRNISGITGSWRQN